MGPCGIVPDTVQHNDMSAENNSHGGQSTSSPARLGGTVRVAMWSGPRNISTALMRSFENRADKAVWDEPLYAHYLRETGARTHATSMKINSLICLIKNHSRKM